MTTTVLLLTTTQDSVKYTHTFQFSELLEQTTVTVVSKTIVPKLKRILRNHHMNISIVSPFDPLCDGKVAGIIEQEDILDTV
jgi:Mg2+/Co2+ transporter CorC